MDKAKPYIPISCSFYDYLEEAATLKRLSVIDYYENGENVNVESRIATLLVRDKVEYMLLENEETIRLDTLISFNGKALPKSC